MKKQLFGLALACSLSLMGMEQFEAPASVRNTKPSLMAILKRKYIDRQPLTKAQQEYLRKAKKPAIAAGLVALGIGATAAGIFAYRGKKRKTESGTYSLPPLAAETPGLREHGAGIERTIKQQEAFMRQNTLFEETENQKPAPPQLDQLVKTQERFEELGLEGTDFLNAVTLATAPDLEEFLTQNPRYTSIYTNLIRDPQLKAALAEARGITEDKLPHR